MSFFQRVLSYVANELLVNRLANRCARQTPSASKLFSPARPDADAVPTHAAALRSSALPFAQTPRCGSSRCSRRRSRRSSFPRVGSWRASCRRTRAKRWKSSPRSEASVAACGTCLRSTDRSARAGRSATVTHPLLRLMRPGALRAPAALAAARQAPAASRPPQPSPPACLCRAAEAARRRPRGKR